MTTTVANIYKPNGNLQYTPVNGVSMGLSAYGEVVLVDGGTHPQPMVFGTVTVTGLYPQLAVEASGLVNIYLDPRGSLLVGVRRR